MNRKVLMSLLVAAGCLSTSFADTAIDDKAKELEDMAKNPAVSIEALCAAVYEAAQSMPEGSDVFLKVVLDARSDTSSSVDLYKVVQAVAAAVPSVGENMTKCLQAQINGVVLPTSMTGSDSGLTSRVVNVVYGNPGIVSMIINQQSSAPSIAPLPVLPTPGETSSFN